MIANPLDEAIRLLPNHDDREVSGSFETQEILKAIDEIGEDPPSDELLSPDEYLLKIEKLERAVEEATERVAAAEKRVNIAEELSRQANERATTAERTMEEAREDLKNVLTVLRRAALQSAAAQKKIVDTKIPQLPKNDKGSEGDKKDKEIVTLICYVLEQDRRANMQTANVIERVLGIKSGRKSRRFKAKID